MGDQYAATKRSKEMSYKITFIFFDGESLNVNVEEKRRDEFLLKAQQKQVYWVQESEDAGFWINFDKVRYFQANRENQAQQQIKTDEDIKDGVEACQEEACGSSCE